MERMARGASIVTGNCSDLKSLNVVVVKKKALFLLESLSKSLRRNGESRISSWALKLKKSDATLRFFEKKELSPPTPRMINFHRISTVFRARAFPTWNRVTLPFPLTFHDTRNRH